MRLTELEPYFVRAGVDGAINYVDSPLEAQGILFLCPKCFVESPNISCFGAGWSGSLVGCSLPSMASGLQQRFSPGNRKKPAAASATAGFFSTENQ